MAETWTLDGLALNDGTVFGLAGVNVTPPKARAEWISAADFEAVRPQDLMPDLKCPVMVIHGEGDPFIPPRDAAAMASSLKSRAHPDDVLWTIPEAGHVLGMAAVGPDEYRARVSAFLDKITSEAAITRTAPAADSVRAAGGNDRD